jgi:YidC/Oxa1 family membrane protein insertase
MILAIVLSAIVLLGWSVLFPGPTPPPANNTQAAATNGVAANQAATPAAPPQASATNAAATAAAAASTDPQCAPDRRRDPANRVRIETPSLRGSLSLCGAQIDDLVLLRHRQAIAANSPPVRLFSPTGTPNAYYASFGWDGPDNVRPRPGSLWTVTGSNRTLTPTTPVTLTWNNGHGQIFRIILSIDDGYLIRAEQIMVNNGAPVTVAANAVVHRATGYLPNEMSNWQSHVGPVGLFNDQANYDTKYDSFGEAPGHQIAHDSHGGWIGFGDKYWLAAVIPNQQSNVTTAFRQFVDAGNAYQADFSTQPRTLGTGQWMRNTSSLFAGAKEIHYLNRYTEALGTDMGRAIDWGWFAFIMKPIFALLTWLFSVLGNFGFAIICLTIIVRLILFPLAQKQFSSMAKMKVLQPKIKALQARYPDDKPRMQQEMMKMYKEEQVNPMAGCLPIFLQIPVFYALYKVLMVAVEMRHEPFILWINDLTAPDPLTPVNLFGLLPFHPPAMLAIGILPILVGVTMWLQQKLNSAPMDPMQQKIFAWMPWILVVIMAPFAAGFQVYWVTNNLISILQIWFLNRKMGINNPPPAVALAAPAPPPAPRPTPSPKPKPGPRPAAKARPARPRKK